MGARFTLPSVTNGGVRAASADGSGSLIDLSALTTMSGNITATNQGRILLAGTTDDPLVEGILLGRGGQLTANLSINAEWFVNAGTLHVANAGNIWYPTGLDLNTPLELDGDGILVVECGDGTLGVVTSSDLLGNTRNADRFAFDGRLAFDGAGTVEAPQRLEAMSQDLGAQTQGYHQNFAYGTLELTGNTYVKLVDLSDNAAGTDAEAVYVQRLIVPADCTLDLNGLKVYARSVEIAGMVVGGSVELLPDGGEILWNTPTLGSISRGGRDGRLDFLRACRADDCGNCEPRQQ